MSNQHITEQQERVEETIGVPLDLEGFSIVKQEVERNGQIRIEIIAKATSAICPRCHRQSRKIHDRRPRVKRDVKLRDDEVKIVLWKRRFRCFACRRPFTEEDQVCGYRRRTMARLRAAVGQQAYKQPVAHVAKAFGVAESFAQSCFEQEVKHCLQTHGVELDETQPLETPTYLGLDEFSRRKGHRYDTIVADVRNRKVLAIGSGRKLEDVQKILERLRDPDAVLAVSMDMSASYRPAVQLCLPKAQIVVDHFHVIQHVMKGFRKVLSSFAHQTESKTLLEGKQYLFLKAKEDLTLEQMQERQQIADQLPDLGRSWELKEALRSWYAKATEATAEAELDAWITQVQQDGPPALRKTLSAFRNWRKEILAFFPLRISNGFVEGKNNRTKTIMRQGYGFSNREHLCWRILFGEIV